MTRNDNTVRGKIIKGLELTHKKLIKSKKEKNIDMVISKNGKIIRVKAKDL